MAANARLKLRILFADDEQSLRMILSEELKRRGHTVVTCEDGRAAVETASKRTFDVAILDIRMPVMTGVDALQHIKEASPDTEVVLLTGHATVETAVQALRHGAFDYLTKPCTMTELESVLQKIAEKRELLNHNLALEKRLDAVEGRGGMVGQSKPMEEIQHLIAKVAPTDATVLILGETGTGKEVTARTLHERSRRAAGPFVPVNCGALPEHLIESELFGHRKGAFTGADTNRKGLFEVANGGTLFLDEIGELPKGMQAKLLRFLESREVRRVGENEPFVVDVRVLCATNRDLRDMVAHDDFREDLYFRINTFEVRLPALRERRDDIPLLAGHLLNRAAKGRDASSRLTDKAIAVIRAYDWPGNVRELANAMEYALILAGDGQIQSEHLPASVRGHVGDDGTFHMPVEDEIPLHDLEQRYIAHILEANGGNKPEAAKKLGISLKTLYNKLNAMAETKSAG